MHLKHIIPLMYSRLWWVRWRNDVGIRFQRTPSSKKCWIIEVVEASDAIRFCTEKMIHNLPTLNFIFLDTLKKTKKYVIHKCCLLLENTSKNNYQNIFLVNFLSLKHFISGQGSCWKTFKSVLKICLFAKLNSGMSIFVRTAIFLACNNFLWYIFRQIFGYSHFGQL